MNTKKQGDIGLGQVIAYYTFRGATVCIPLTDSQHYDLVVEENGVLKRVEVKRCTRNRGNGVYEVGLSVKGGNKTRVAQCVRKFDSSRVDVLAVSTPDGLYIIPSDAVRGRQGINLGKSYQEFKTQQTPEMEPVSDCKSEVPTEHL